MDEMDEMPDIPDATPKLMQIVKILAEVNTLNSIMAFAKRNGVLPDEYDAMLVDSNIWRDKLVELLNEELRLIQLKKEIENDNG